MQEQPNTVGPEVPTVYQAQTSPAAHEFADTFVQFMQRPVMVLQIAVVEPSFGSHWELVVHPHTPVVAVVGSHTRPLPLLTELQSELQAPQVWVA